MSEEWKKVESLKQWQKWSHKEKGGWGIQSKVYILFTEWYGQVELQVEDAEGRGKLRNMIKGQWLGVLGNFLYVLNIQSNVFNLLNVSNKKHFVKCNCLFVNVISVIGLYSV